MNLMELFIKIGVDDQASSQVETLSGKFKKGLVLAAKVGGAAISAAATGIAALTKSAISNYAEYEQLVGGVETLFKDSSDTVMKYAENAYKTAGLSANDYMSTVTSFSASLLQSLGGDTAQAAEYANRALTDMSDNANKMGTGMEMIQNAYSGFAKQNYTMLDNLKLGYGGTQSEMQRLIKDAAKLTDVQKELGITVDANSMSFGNIVNAISVVQSSMGIMGTTAAEASSTIQGSIGMMKAAWENFLTGMADPSSNFDALINNLVDSVETVAEQLVPRILATVPRLLEGISALIGSLSQKLPGLINDVLGTVLEELPKIATMLSDMLIELVDMIGRNGGKIVDAALKLVNNLIAGLTKLAPKLLKTVSQLAVDIVTSFAKNLPGIIQAASDFLVAFVEGLMDSLDIIIDSLPTIIEAVVDGLDESIPILIDAVIAIVETVLEALPEILPKLVEAVSSLLTKLSEMITNRQDDFVRLFGSIATAIAQALPELVTALTPAITTLVETLANVLATLTPQLGEIGVQILMAIFSAFSQNAGAYVEALGSLVSGLITVIGENAQMILNLGTELLLAIGDAIMQCAQDGTLAAAGESLISGMWDAAISVATSLGKALFGAIISGFNLGNKMYTPENFAKQQQELFGATPAPQDIPLPEGIPVIGGGGGFGGGLTINQTINGTNMTAAQAFREAKTQQLAAQWMTGGF